MEEMLSLGANKMVPTDMLALFLAPNQLCSILVLLCYFLHYLLIMFLLLPTYGNNFGTLYQRSLYFPDLDPLELPEEALFIPGAAPKRRSWRRGRRSGALVRLRQRTYHPPLLSILLADV